MRNKSLLLSALGITVLASLSLLVMRVPPTASAKSGPPAKIVWSRNPVTATLTSGSMFSTTVTFTSTMSLTNVILRLTPSLRATTTVTPSTFLTITAGVPYTIEIDVAIPANTMRKAFNGVLTVRMGHHAFARPLKLRFAIQHSNVTIKDFMFTPATITVHVGQAVMWRNHGPSQHTTTSDAALWNSGPLDVGATFSQTFNSPGSFPYHCAIHPFMHGTVVVMP